MLGEKEGHACGVSEGYGEAVNSPMAGDAGDLLQRRDGSAPEGAAVDGEECSPESGKLPTSGSVDEVVPGYSKRKEFDAERKSKKEAYEKAHHVKADQDERYPKGLIVAFKLRKATLDGPVQESKSHEVNDTATEVGTSNSADNPSGEGPEERILESNGMKEQKSSNDIAKWKEVNTVEATKSSEKCTDDALAESENNGESEALSKGCRSLSGDVNNLISREDLKEAFKKFGTVQFVDFSIGNDSGYLRFEDSKAAEKARVSAVLVDEGGLIVKDHIVTVELVTGEAEKDYWNKIRSTREKCKDNGSYKGRAGKINGKRGRHFNSTNNVPNKAQKVEATA